MPHSAQLAIAMGLSYLLGAVPFAWLLGKLRGVDIRRVGSGNIGATNLTRALGRRWGVAAFALDFLKGLAPALLVPWLAPRLAREGEAVDPALAGIVCGAAAILGHVYPVYLRFRGGKGVATTFGVLAALMPWATTAAAAAWGLAYLATRTVSIASIFAAFAFPLAAALLCSRESGASYGALVTLASAAGALVLLRHRANIQRLLAGKEHRF
jgi:glycerol-3-phosphate acyltransferase PlsY